MLPEIRNFAINGECLTTLPLDISLSMNESDTNFHEQSAERLQLSDSPTSAKGFVNRVLIKAAYIKTRH